MISYIIEEIYNTKLNNNEIKNNINEKIFNIIKISKNTSCELWYFYLRRYKILWIIQKIKFIELVFI